MSPITARVSSRIFGLRYFKIILISSTTLYMASFVLYFSTSSSSSEDIGFKSNTFIRAFDVPILKKEPFALSIRGFILFSGSIQTIFLL